MGRGAGGRATPLSLERLVVSQADQRARSRWAEDRLAPSPGGRTEIAAMAGFFVEAHATGSTVLLDGYVAGAAGGRSPR